MRRRLKDVVKQTVRDLRKRQTDSEAVLWQRIRDRKLCDKKFLRQYPIVFEWNGQKRFLVADFYCHEAKLIVELDGPIHDRQKDYDEVRNFVLRSLGVKILRFRNEEIKKDLRGVVGLLKEEIGSPSPSLFKRGGKEGVS